MELLLLLITMSMIGALLWLCLFLTRPITQRFFSQTWHYYTSLIPLFFFLGGSRFIVPFVQGVHTILQRTDVSVSPDDLASVTVAQQVTVNPALINVLVNDATSKLSLNTLAHYAFIIWVTGMLVFFILKLSRYYQFKLKVLKLSVIHKKEQSPVKVIKSTVVTTPMLLGVWKPVIVLPIWN